MSKTIIGGACLNQTPIDWAHNTANILQAIELAQKNKVKILCLPELCITSYGCQDLFLNDWVLEETIDQLMKIVPCCQGIAVAIGLPIKHDHKVYNTTCVIDDGIIKGFYAKQILANEGIHYESRWFSPWPADYSATISIQNHSFPIGNLTFHLEGIHVGFEICEDAWNEQRPACQLHTKGVQLILNPSASHFSFDKYKTREQLVIGSSLQFNCHYLYVNQLGNESGRVIYDGDILLAGHGALLAAHERLSFHPFRLLYHEIDTHKSGSKPSIPFEISNRNKDFAKAASLALYDYLKKSHTKGYTLSLSGGADSSSIAILVAEMVSNGVKTLGVNQFLNSIGSKLDLQKNKPEEENIKKIINSILVTAYQGTENSSNTTLNSARSLADSIGAQFMHWDIDLIVEGNQAIVEKAIGRNLDWKTDDIAMQNIQARSRSPLIWMIANINQSILLTTSNRSEGDVGYTTMDGDTSGSLAPIAGVDKPFIIQWLQYAEKELGYEGLTQVNSLAPTAELRPKEQEQNDEDDLMPYATMVAIERLAIFKRKSPIQVYDMLSSELNANPRILKRHIKKFFKLWAINQWKRERLAPSFHLDDFNVDPKSWCRFPILSGSFQQELKKLDQI